MGKTNEPVGTDEPLLRPGDLVAFSWNDVRTILYLTDENDRYSGTMKVGDVGLVVSSGTLLSSWTYVISSGGAGWCLTSMLDVCSTAREVTR